MSNNLLLELLEARMNERKLSLREAAEQIGVSHTTISRMLNGQSSGDINTVLKICQWLEVSPSYIFNQYVNDGDTESAVNTIVQYNPEFAEVLREAAGRIERGEIDPRVLEDLVGYISYRLSGR